MAFLILGSGSLPAGADPIGYFSDGSFLLRIDLANGDATLVGPFGPGVGVNALAFGPDGTLYGVGYMLSGEAHLVAIDPATGLAKLVTELSLNDPSNHFESMTADACGRLYVGGLMGVSGGGLRQKVVEIDPVTGSLEEIVSLATGGPQGLAARGETLFTVANGVLARIDPSTGAITPIAGESVPELDYDFAADGFLWGASYGGPLPIPVPPSPGHAYRLDPQTGEWVRLAEHFQAIFTGIAIAPPPGACGTTLPLAIPAVSPVGLILLAILLAAAGSILVRRRAVRLNRTGSATTRFLTMAIVIASGSPSADADPTGLFLGPLSGGESGLLRIDLADGEVSEIGPFGPGVGPSAIAFAPDGTLYGVGHTLSGGAHLVAIDPATAATVLVTELTLNDPFNHFQSMTADACGRLYVGGLMGVFGGGLREKVVVVDPVTGTLEEILSLADGGSQGLAARGETLFRVAGGVLSRLDPSTGEITPVGGELIPGLDYDFAADGFLWGVSTGAPPPLPIPVPGLGQTFRLDPQTGELAVVAEHSQPVWAGLAIGPPPGACGTTLPLAIPAVSPVGLILLASLLAAAGSVLVRRRALLPPRAR